MKVKSTYITFASYLFVVVLVMGLFVIYSIVCFLVITSGINLDVLRVIKVTLLQFNVLFEFINFCFKPWCVGEIL